MGVIPCTPLIYIDGVLWFSEFTWFQAICQACARGRGSAWTGQACRAGNYAKGVRAKFRHAFVRFDKMVVLNFDLTPFAFTSFSSPPKAFTYSSIPYKSKRSQYATDPAAGLLEPRSQPKSHGQSQAAKQRRPGCLARQHLHRAVVCAPPGKRDGAQCGAGPVKAGRP